MSEPRVIYQDKNFLAVDKPSGLVVHAAKVAAGKLRAGEPEPTLVDWLLERCPEIKRVGDDPAQRPGIVHRLDKDTSGVMLIPKTQEYFEYLKSLFQKHEIQKTYFAVVVGVPKNKEGVIDAPIGIKNGTLKRSVRSTKMLKEAITKYKVVKSWSLGDEPYSLLEVHPLTGRTHQIRVHLASIGHPIVGDRLYGRKTKPKTHSAAMPRLMLHAGSIEFAPKPGKHLKIETEFPAEFSTGALFTGRQ